MNNKEKLKLCQKISRYLRLNYLKQECISVGCVPSAAVVVSWVYARFPPPSPVDRITDACEKQNLSATVAADGNNIMIVHNLSLKGTC